MSCVVVCALAMPIEQENSQVDNEQVIHDLEPQAISGLILLTKGKLLAKKLPYALLLKKKLVAGKLLAVGVAGAAGATGGALAGGLRGLITTTPQYRQEHY